MKLQDILANLHDFTEKGNANPFITSLEMDSREVEKGCLFFCVKGSTFDGHVFASEAESKGAVAIIAEKDVEVSIPVIKVKDTRRAMAVLADAFYQQPTHKLQLIGVTGTNGKTSISHIVEEIFKEAGEKTGLIGTMYTKIGEKTIEMKNTTPESVTLQKFFHQMVSDKVTRAVMEVSSHALDIGRVHGCDFDIAVFSNLTQDHLDYHRTIDEYRRVKGLLFASLGNRFDKDNPKYAVLNNDDPASEEYTRSTSATIVTYGIQQKADIMAANIRMTASGTEFDLKTPFGSYEVKINLIGQFSVYNVLAAVTTCIVSGIPISTIIRAIKKVKGVPGRFEIVNQGQNFTVIVDYAHTPDSLENVLKTVKQFAKGKINVIIGCGGDRDRSKRPIMAKIATEFADVPIFTSDNPRSEDPLEILKEMEAGVEGKFYITIPDREKAIIYAISNASENDIIIIAGKGHETYQIIGNKTHSFDDRLVAARAIKELN
ncbi:UDP-N-acetylmuramoyl-L-alanyl-D-glutamate--2,6-diaminopimelate ligase [Bacillus timonensis]|uniref:UDP-N-acetylmuramoyl-L-alanyl-D-glutamate--2,6-diaminopimelate ligase n=1 Tax=Bacillus timonensis TaxID=1033734 RepID=A0A4S3PXD7_9BACI|nr:UDP-N-acetylmuramoyl-L-alanyl-D-glutamate--2,6-diaminopimelate ligase [Bacillus timonensis]THE14541.1 UDP-N-acetylmuramoyl-L-alanyl-D-glutamate--2,6-diaminopimelate ligase [Bacillus timonensis]